MSWLVSPFRACPVSNVQGDVLHVKSYAKHYFKIWYSYVTPVTNRTGSILWRQVFRMKLKASQYQHHRLKFSLRSTAFDAVEL